MMPGPSPRWAAVFFDFDGVIAQSNQAKDDAFYELFLPYGKDVADAVVAFNQAQAGLSRFVKFEWAFTTLLHKVRVH